MHLNLTSGLNIICFIACISTGTQAQVTNQNSDSATVELLRTKSRDVQSTKPDSALIYAQQGLDLSKKIGYKIGEGDCLNRLGVVYWKNGKYNRALLLIINSLKLREEINDRLGVLKSLNDIGIIYADQGDNKKALTYHFKAKAIAESLKDKKRLSIVLSNIGNCYLKLNKINLALSYELQAYGIQHALNDKNTLPNTLSILGDINYKMGNIPLALEYYRLSIPYAIDNNDQSAIADTYTSIAQLYIKTNRPDSGLYYASDALKAAKIAAYPEGIYNSSSLLTAYYHNKDEHLELTYYKIAIAARDSMFNAEKIREIQNLSFNEAARQQEITEEKNRESEERIINLQLIGIAIFIPFFFLLMLVLSKSRINRRVIEFMSVLSLLMCFEFITLLIHPLVQLISNHLPVIELLILVVLAAILVPLHHMLTHWLREKLAHVTHHSAKTAAVPAVEDGPLNA
jgi:tetratricopeptide (TPR) repeat protein